MLGKLRIGREVGAMKEDRRKKLVYVLRNADSWVSAPMLAKMLGVSERTIRNYVTELSAHYQIESSKAGYRIVGDTPTTPAKSKANAIDNSVDARVDLVLSRLLNSTRPTSVFDIADELAVSESTVTNSVLPSVRQLVGDFGMHLASHNFQLELEGAEKDKRRLLGWLATHNAYGYFSSTKTLSEMFPDFDTDAILSRLVEICQQSELLLNNYSLNNLLVHILVIIIRLESRNELDQADDLIDVNGLLSEVRQRNEIMRCANEIAKTFEQTFHCSIPDRDFRQIVLLIALSTDRYDYSELDSDKLTHLVDEQFLDNMRDIALDTTERYGLSPFDDEFLLQLTLHIYNAYQRALFEVHCPNPIAAQIKQSYAPIYDMAVYLVHRFQGLYSVVLNEDEIAFIAFHIGAYLERNKELEKTISCVVVVERYHDFSGALVRSLETTFADELTITAVVGYDEFVAAPRPCDLLVTTIELPMSPPSAVLVSPLLSKHDIRRIRSQIDVIEEEQEANRARAFLRGLLRPSLYLRNAHVADAEGAIDLLGGLCRAEGVVGPGFVEDVKLREKVSSTAFTDCLAVPHAISQFANASFICVLHNDAPIPWGRNEVNFVMLIGLAQKDMSHFRDAFDIIIDLFSSVDSTMRIMSTDTFEEFASSLISHAPSTPAASKR